MYKTTWNKQLQQEALLITKACVYW